MKTTFKIQRLLDGNCEAVVCVKGRGYGDFLDNNLKEEGDSRHDILITIKKIFSSKHHADLWMEKRKPEILRAMDALASL